MNDTTPYNFKLLKQTGFLVETQFGLSPGFRNLGETYLLVTLVDVFYHIPNLLKVVKPKL